MDVDKVAFTGSVEVGKKVSVAAAESNLKRVSLELGGKSPLIVFEDADIDAAIKISQLGLFFNQGQVCTASSRLFVNEKIYDKFVQKSKEASLSIKVGDPKKEDTFQGPQVSEEQFKKVLSYIEEGKKSGAKLECGGERLGNEGYFIKPTVFSNVDDKMKIYNEEIFGPVMSIIKFSSIEEVIKKANSSPYGLAAGVITKDINKALSIANNIQAGTVWVNTYHHYDSGFPFGGYKESGYGREKGIESVESYLQTKTVIMKYDDYNGELTELK